MTLAGIGGVVIALARAWGGVCDADRRLHQHALEVCRRARVDLHGTFLVTGAGGYRLDVSDDDIDARCFERAAHQAHERLLADDVVTEPLRPVQGMLPVREVTVDEDRLAAHRMSADDEAFWRDRLVATRALDTGSGARRG